MNIKIDFKEKFAAVIQARLRSQRCPNKMIRPFANTTLLDIALEKFAAESSYYSFYFAAYEEELINRALPYRCNILHRNSASAFGEQISEVMNYLQAIPQPYIVFINACSPCLTRDTVERAITVFEEKECLSLTAVRKKHTWYYSLEGKAINFLDPTNLNTKTTQPLYEVTHNIHIFDRERFLLNGYFWENKHLDPYLFEIEEKEAIDIDTEFDFSLAESWFIAQKKSIINKNRIYDLVKNIRLLVSDVDGVLTDAGMYYSKEGDFAKKFNTRDGMGIRMVKQKGIEVAFVTGENTPIVENRAKKLGIKHLFMNIEDKKQIVLSLSKQLAIPLNQIAYVGDDLNDMSAMQIVGFPVAVADAALALKNIAQYITFLKGGEGALREVCDIIIGVTFRK